MYVDAEYANEETVAGGFFFSDGGQITVNGSGWCSHPPCTPPSGLSITSPPLAPLTILHPPTPPHPTPPTVTESQLQLLIGSLLGEKSTSPQATYQKLLQQEGRMKLSGMTCGRDGRGGGINV